MIVGSSCLSQINTNIGNRMYYIIMRNMPKGLTNGKSIVKCVELAPSQEVLNSYKNNKMSFYEFKTCYIDEILEDDHKCYIIRNILSETCKRGVIPIFTCCESDRNVCHRHILTDIIIPMIMYSYDLTIYEYKKDKEILMKHRRANGWNINTGKNRRN